MQCRHSLLLQLARSSQHDIDLRVCVCERERESVCVCVCVNIYIYIYTHTHTHTHIESMNQHIPDGQLALHARHVTATLEPLGEHSVDILWSAEHTGHVNVGPQSLDKVPVQRSVAV